MPQVTSSSGSMRRMRSTSSSMKCIRHKSLFEDCEITDNPIPEVPKDGARVRVRDLF